jgi:regulatory protein
MRSRSQRSGSFRGKPPRKDEARGSGFASRGGVRNASHAPSGPVDDPDAEPPVFRRLADRVPELPPAAAPPPPDEDLPVFVRFADRRPEPPSIQAPSVATDNEYELLRGRPLESAADESPSQAAASSSKPAFDTYRRALGLLVRREHSRRELKRKLGAKGADPLQAEAALDTLAGQGYQDDARFAEMLVRTRIGAGYGPLHIRAEMGTHGIAAEVASAALLEGDPDWPALAIDALRRRYGSRAVRDRAETLKRAHYLQRRGFDLACIRAALAVDLDD